MDYQIVNRHLLTDSDRNSMFEMMKENFSGVKRHDFDSDLQQKDYVIILKSDGVLCGFSTFALSRHIINGRPIRIAFSGDTIISKQNRNSIQLPVSFGILMNQIEKISDEPLYWMLISKGFRTYRFMPVYFKEFYPVFNRETPFQEKSIMNYLGEKFFPDRFSSATGIISSSGQAIRSSCEDLEVIAKRDDPHIQFFDQRNRHWQKGDELLCLVRYSRQNLNPFIVKVLDREEKKMVLQV